jgi:hypothetical protein
MDALFSSGIRSTGNVVRSHSLRLTPVRLWETDLIAPSGDARALEQYVNDRPYVASSFLSVALARAFKTSYY